uniref:Uncharacterized protein n=1 Tax=Heterorhabditis bacteriophora TaxID=37862 RepID=A0A1I7W7H2_HETBA
MPAIVSLSAEKLCKLRPLLSSCASVYTVNDYKRGLMKHKNNGTLKGAIVERLIQSSSGTKLLSSLVHLSVPPVSILWMGRIIVFSFLIYVYIFCNCSYFRIKLIYSYSHIVVDIQGRKPLNNEQLVITFTVADHLVYMESNSTLKDLDSASDCGSS